MSENLYRFMQNSPDDRSRNMLKRRRKIQKMHRIHPNWVFSDICSRVLVTETEFGLVIGFINSLQLVTTNNYNTVPDLHNLQSLHSNLLRLFPLVFTIRFLATDLNSGVVTDSHFKYHCTKSLLITINAALPLFLHLMVYCCTHTTSLLVKQLKPRN
jgi:hypothetical protein